MGWLTIGDIRSFRPAVVQEARRRVELDRRQLLEVLTGLLRARRAGPQHWSGPAAEVAFERQSDAIRVLSDLASRLAQTAGVLDHLSLRMRSAHELVRHADRRAAEARAWINHEGTLFVPGPPAYLDPVLAAHHARQVAALRAEVERDLRQAERLARDTDGEVLRRLLAAADATAVPPAWSSVRGAVLAVPPPPSVRRGGVTVVPSGFASSAWWRSLSGAEQALVIDDHPDWIGPRDGVPAWARHRANLVLLGRAEQAARDLVARSTPALTPFGMVRLEKARRAMADLQAIRDLLALPDGVPRQLLLVDASAEQVTAAVAIGNVDTAAHVATFVGGLGTTVGGELRRYDATFQRLRRDARSIAADGGDVAIVTWLGYPAPQPREILDPGRTVLRDVLARDYADELAAFLTGLAAARDTPIHSTLWAHSYGSTLAGNALLQTGAVDDVVVFGSPGLPFQRLDDVGLKPGALNVMAAPDDIVAEFGSVLLGTPPLLVTGARRLATVWVKGMPNHLATSRGHSEYLSSGTVTERSLVAVAAGRPDLVIEASATERASRPLTTTLDRPDPLIPLARPRVWMP